MDNSFAERKSHRQQDNEFENKTSNIQNAYNNPIQDPTFVKEEKLGAGNKLAEINDRINNNMPAKMRDEVRELMGLKRKEKNGEMDDVKAKVSALENLLDNTGTSPEQLSTVLNAYKNAIDSCKTYLNNKNPWKQEGQLRKQVVRDTMNRLISEKEHLEIFRINIEGNVLDAEGYDTPLSLLNNAEKLLPPGDLGNAMASAERESLIALKKVKDREDSGEMATIKRNYRNFLNNVIIQENLMFADGSLESQKESVTNDIATVIGNCRTYITRVEKKNQARTVAGKVRLNAIKEIRKKLVYLRDNLPDMMDSMDNARKEGEKIKLSAVYYAVMTEYEKNGGKKDEDLVEYGDIHENNTEREEEPGIRNNIEDDDNTINIEIKDNINDNKIEENIEDNKIEENIEIQADKQINIINQEEEDDGEFKELTAEEDQKIIDDAKEEIKGKIGELNGVITTDIDPENELQMAIGRLNETIEREKRTMGDDGKPRKVNDDYVKKLEMRLANKKKKLDYVRDLKKNNLTPEITAEDKKFVNGRFGMGSQINGSIFGKYNRLSFLGLRQSKQTCYLTAAVMGMIDHGYEDYIRNEMITEDDDSVTVKLFDNDGLPVKVILDKSKSKNDPRPLWYIMIEKAAMVMLDKSSYGKEKARNTETSGAAYPEDVIWDKLQIPDNTFKADSLENGSEDLAIRLLLGKKGVAFKTRTQNTNSLYKNTFERSPKTKESAKALGQVKGLLDMKKVVIASTCGKLDKEDINKLIENDPQMKQYSDNYCTIKDAVNYKNHDIQGQHVYLIREYDDDKKIINCYNPETGGSTDVTYDEFRRYFTDIRAF